MPRQSFTSSETQAEVCTLKQDLWAPASDIRVTPLSASGVAPIPTVGMIQTYQNHQDGLYAQHYPALTTLLRDCRTPEGPGMSRYELFATP